MSRLLLLRHAKAAATLPGTGDHARRLDDTGRREAHAVGAAMAARGLVPGLVFCSDAARARETLAGIGDVAAKSSVACVHALYAGGVSDYLQAARSAGDAACAMLVGHNPMVEGCATALFGDGEERAAAILRRGFPTCGLAVFAFPGPLSRLVPGAGRLEAFLTPHDG